jgi:hypothetical protein
MSTETETNAKPDAAGTVTDADHELMGRREHVATALFGGHLTIMRFGSNRRVSFTTPNDRHDITANGGRSNICGGGAQGRSTHQGCSLGRYHQAACRRRGGVHGRDR